MKTKERVVPLKNSYCGIDYDDILTIPAKYKTIKFGKDRAKSIKIKVASEKKYVRLVALKDFVVKGEVVEKGKKGAYLELKHGICFFSIGKNSWAEGSFMATEKHPTLIETGCAIGNNTLVGKNCKIGKHTEIANNCKIEGCCKIGSGCVIKDNVVLRETMVGENTYIGKDAIIGVKTLDNHLALAGGSAFIGVSPNHYNYYWWNKKINPHNFAREKLTLRDAWERYVKEKYYKYLNTYISDNAQIDLGTQIFAGATIGQNAKIGRCVEVQPRRVVGENFVVQDKEIVR